MLDYLLHLWAAPPADLQLDCPPPAEGDIADPFGFYNPEIIHSAYTTIGVASLAAVLLLVLGCYLMTRTSLGPGFVRRWWIFLGLSALAGFLIPLSLRLWETRALAGTCDTNPTPFAEPLPWNLILERSVAGLVWAPLVFVLLSLLLTRTLGYLPQSGGFFHNRGCPAPRFY